MRAADDKFIGDIAEIQLATHCNALVVGFDDSGYTVSFGQCVWFYRDDSNIFPWGVKIVDAPQEWRFKTLQSAINAARILEAAHRCAEGIADGHGLGELP